MPNILVVGSMNMDIVTQVERHPVPGETIQGLETQFYSGGKGANQAVAASRSGAKVTMAGGLGSDTFARMIRSGLESDGINLDYVKEMNQPTGIALITIDQLGENNIILSAGANGALIESDVEQIPLGEYDALLMQNEIPEGATRKVLELAAEAGVPVFMNPAPLSGFDRSLLSMVDFLIVNEIEAGELTGISVDHMDNAHAAGRLLLQEGISHVVVTLGSKGSLYLDQQQTFIETPAFPVEAIDTTAAGDTFIGALAAKYAAGETLQDGLRYATAASALTVSGAGAQSSIPLEAQVLAFLERTDI